LLTKESLLKFGIDGGDIEDNKDYSKDWIN